MAYADIEGKIHSLLDDALDSDVSVSRGYHSPNELKSVAVRPGAATRQMQGERGRVSTFTAEVEMKVSSGLDLPAFHADVLGIRQTITDAMDERPTLDNLSGVTSAMLTSFDAPSNTTEGRVHTFQQILYVSVKYVHTIATGEYA